MQTEIETVENLLDAAWSVRAHSRLIGKTAVGCAVLSSSGSVHVGCNVEHQFRSHDIHAEVNALSTMIAAGDSQAVAIAIAAERERFTPCGACLDWVFELGGRECIVFIQSQRAAKPTRYLAVELMPHYPR
jgi:cytidine deaminase